MVKKQQEEEVAKVEETHSFALRTLTKSGQTRYLSVGTLVPKDWIACKVYILHQEQGIVILRLEQIK